MVQTTAPEIELIVQPKQPVSTQQPSQRHLSEGAVIHAGETPGGGLKPLEERGIRELYKVSHSWDISHLCEKKGHDLVGLERARSGLQLRSMLRTAVQLSDCLYRSSPSGGLPLVTPAPVTAWCTLVGAILRFIWSAGERHSC